MVSAWLASYPLSISSVDDYVFYRIPILYWISVPLLIISMFSLALNTKSNYLKWALTVGIIFTFFSISFFFPSMTSSDSHTFRGLTEYLIQTKSLDTSNPYHLYYQWPAFFIFSDVATTVTGIQLTLYEFLQYALIGLLITSSLFVYASRLSNKSNGIAAVVSFFIAAFYFFNYQDVPFSFAFALLSILFMLESKEKNYRLVLIITIIFACITLTHLFVALFYVLYQLIYLFFKRDKFNIILVPLTLTIYISLQSTLAGSFFPFAFQLMTGSYSDYSLAVSSTLRPLTIPFDVTAQFFSRAVVLVVLALCGTGFIFLLLKRKLRTVDKVLFLTGAVYGSLGFVLSILGMRAVVLALIPLSLGVSYLFEQKFKRYLKPILLILLMLFTFAIIHTTFGDYPIQSKQDLSVSNFVLDEFDLKTNYRILSDVYTTAYLHTLASMNLVIDDVYSTPYNSSTIGTYDSVIYSIYFEQTIERFANSPSNVTNEIQSRFNVIYTSGLDYIAIKPDY